MSERLHDINKLYKSLEYDHDQLALILTALLYPQQSYASHDEDRRQLLALTARMHDTVNVIVSKTLEHDRQRRKRSGKVDAA